LFREALGAEKVFGTSDSGFRAEYNRADMTPEISQAPEAPPERMSEISRLTGVFFEPSKTFEDVARRPTFLVPMVLVMICALAVTVTFSQHVGWERFMRQQFENSPRAAQLTPEQRESAISMQMKIVPITSTVGVLVVIPLYYTVASAVFMAILAILSAKVKFKQIFSVMAYAGVIGVISSLLTIVVMFMKNPDQFNLQNALAFNPGAFMDPQSGSKFVYSLASSLDLFSIWGIILIALGLKAAAGKSISFGGALATVVIPWAVYVLGKSALAGVFS